MQLTSQSRSTFDRNSYLIAVFFPNHDAFLPWKGISLVVLSFYFRSSCIENRILHISAPRRSHERCATQRWTRPCYIPIGREQRAPRWLAFGHYVTGASIPIKFRLWKFFVHRLGHAETHFFCIFKMAKTRVFFDIAFDGTPAGRVVMEVTWTPGFIMNNSLVLCIKMPAVFLQLRPDVVPKTAGEYLWMRINREYQLVLGRYSGIRVV